MSLEVNFQFGSPVSFRDFAGDIESIGYPVEMIIHQIAAFYDKFYRPVRQQVAEPGIGGIDGLPLI